MTQKMIIPFMMMITITTLRTAAFVIMSSWSATASSSSSNLNYYNNNNNNNHDKHYKKPITGPDVFHTTTTKSTQLNDHLQESFNEILKEDMIMISSSDTTTTTTGVGVDSIGMVPNDNNDIILNNNNNDPYNAHWKLFPKSYVAYKIPSSFTATIPNNNNNNNNNNDTIITTNSFYDIIDGDVLNKDIWNHIPWSTTFHDIQGEEYDNDIKNHGTPPGITKFKCMYDETHIYIGAILYPAYNISTETYYTQRNSPIFHTDSDFEVFIDAYTTTHQYKELELNSINTIWNLLLNKPYNDGGIEHSARITQNKSDPVYYEVYHQKTATKIVDGILNDHINNIGALWTVEIAIAYSDLFATASTTTSTTTSTATTTEQEQEQQMMTKSLLLYPPKMGNNYYRINFSRVEKQGDINWTWQSQNIRWDPKQNKYHGYIDMHIPDSWGYLYFSNQALNMNPSDHNNDNNRHEMLIEPIDIDVTWPAKLSAMTIYYALHYYNEIYNGTYTDNINDLILPCDIIEPFDIMIDLNPNSTNHDNDQDRIDFVVNVYSKSTIIKKTSTSTTTTTTSTNNHQNDNDNQGTDAATDDDYRIYARVQSDRYLTAGLVSSNNEQIETH